MEPDAPVRPAHQHEHNLALVTRLAARSGPVSRARLAQQSGLTKSTVTQLVAELLDAGLLRELGTGRSAGPGRPANLLVLNSQGPSGIGLQVGPDHVAGHLVDLTGRIRERAIRRAEGVGESPERAVRAAEPVLRRLLNSAVNTDSVVAGLVVGVPGMPASEHSASLGGPGWTAAERLLDGRLEALGAAGLPVTVTGATDLVARAEAAGDESGGTLVYVGGEEGVEIAVVAGGSVHAGARGAAGRLGHLRVRARGKRCRCGAKGCLDTVAGRRAILRAAGLDDASGSRLTGGDGPLPGLVREGEQDAVSAARRAASALGEALAGVAAALDPATVVLGGYLAPLGQPFADAVRAALLSRLPGAGSVGIRPSRLPPDAVARAAAGTVTRRLLDDPARWLELA